MMARLKQFAMLIMLSALVVSQSGCFALLAGAAVGAGTIAFVSGDLETNLDAPVERVHDASLRALRKLALPTHMDTEDQHISKIRAKYADGKEVSIAITALTERTSKVQIRVGTFGDQTRSEHILSTIKKYL